MYELLYNFVTQACYRVEGFDIPDLDSVTVMYRLIRICERMFEWFGMKC